ncbi:hypothetical protein Tco_0755845 [Tanacetum coccineum]
MLGAHLPRFVTEHIYPEFMPSEDDVLPAEEQPLPAAVLPTADSPGYITKSDPKEDLGEEDDEDHEEDQADYLADRDDNDDGEEESSGDDADDDEDEDEDEEEEEHLALANSEEESSRDDAGNEEEDEGEDEEEEEHLASADSIPLLACGTTARMSIRDQTPIQFLSTAQVDRFLAISTPPPSPLTSYSSPITPPSGTPPILPIPLPTSSPPLLPPYTDCRVDATEVSLLPRKRLCIAPGPKYEVEESSFVPTARHTGGFRADYDIWEDPNEIAEEIPATDVAELGQRMTNFVMTVRQDTDEIYGRLDDA